MNWPVWAGVPARVSTVSGRISWAYRCLKLHLVTAALDEFLENMFHALLNVARYVPIEDVCIPVLQWDDTQ